MSEIDLEKECLYFKNNSCLLIEYLLCSMHLTCITTLILIWILRRRYNSYSHFTAKEVEDTLLVESSPGFKICLYCLKSMFFPVWDGTSLFQGEKQRKQRILGISPCSQCIRALLLCNSQVNNMAQRQEERKKER